MLFSPPAAARAEEPHLHHPDWGREGEMFPKWERGDRPELWMVCGVSLRSQAWPAWILQPWEKESQGEIKSVLLLLLLLLLHHLVPVVPVLIIISRRRMLMITMTGLTMFPPVLPGVTVTGSVMSLSTVWRLKLYKRCWDHVSQTIFYFSSRSSYTSSLTNSPWRELRCSLGTTPSYTSVPWWEESSSSLLIIASSQTPC